MDTSQPQLSTTTTAATSSGGLFGTKIPASAAFIIAILLFLLPFAEIKCNGSAVANNTGLGIAMGSDWKQVVVKNIFGNAFDENYGQDAAGQKRTQKQDPNKFAIGALALGIVALLFALLAPRGAGKITTFVGILA